MNTLDRLNNPSLLVIFLYAPTGLGHLRVTKALYEGLPKSASHVLLGAEDTSSNFFHRFTSSSPLAKELMERSQYGAEEKIVTFFYRCLMKRASSKLAEDVTHLLKQQITVPKTVLIIATHPGLALEFAAIKKQLEKEHQIRIFLVVQVTDDSPQLPWDVPGADIIFTPSEQTSRILALHHRHEHSPATHVITAAYPISPSFAQPLPRELAVLRSHQMAPDRDTSIHVAIPVSGAAIGLEFIKKFIHTLSSLSPRFKFHIVSKRASFTTSFLEHMSRHQTVKILSSEHDRDVITLYQGLYLNTVISLELTKPSEQTFKALADPKKVGGTLLLFAEPVGRQEYDNITFLERHHLIPTDDQMSDLCTGRPRRTTIQTAKEWRGVILPQEPQEAANFTFSCLMNGIFSEMITYQPPKESSHSYVELNPYGVSAFWKTVSYLLE